MSTIAWRHDLKRKLVWLLAIKLAALTLIGYFLFPPAQRPAVDPAAAAEHLGAGQ
ncbi:MAG TPA: hypothetical protein VE046_10205 [Steroidobacteraceae bacterium]|nr:hypothetical protein [Steroidobacteraceae bacterium]